MASGVGYVEVIDNKVRKRLVDDRYRAKSERVFNNGVKIRRTQSLGRSKLLDVSRLGNTASNCS